VCVVHCHVIKHGSVEDTFMGNALMDAYSKKGGFLEALKMFDEMLMSDIIS
jgi:pentatricopeptide repeat protein